MNSGVEWLGEVPDHWSLTKVKHVYRFTTGWTPPSGRSESYEGNNLWANISDLGSKVLSDTAKRISDDAVDEFGMKMAPQGSLLFSFKLSIGQVSFAGSDMYTNEAIASFLPDQHYSLSFAYYALPFFVPQNASENIYGAKMLNQELIRSALICIPPTSEQIAIAAFLDRETAKIDAFIEEQRRLIALLNEKRQAVVSHAITKGLSPQAPMKDSGIEWLGEVPAHWEVGPLKRHWSVTDCKHITADFVDEGRPLASIKEVQSQFVDLSSAKQTTDEFYAELIEGSRKPEAGDLIFSRNATVGEVAQVADFHPPFAMGQDVCLLKRREADTCSDYLQLVIMSSVGKTQLANLMIGSTFKRVNVEEIRNLVLPFPPPQEQREIATWLLRNANQFCDLSEQAERGIALLTERRAALISAAVTGKIDLRGSAKVLPFPVDRVRARGLIATEIIERLAHQPTFGRVKFQKIAFLAEAHVGINELEGSYTREAAGPLDRLLIDEMESGARSIGGIEHEQPGGPGTTVSYRLGQQGGAHRQELTGWLGAERTAKLDKLIADCASLTTKQAEAVATLYGVWNDALSEGTSPTDDEIISGFLNDWHPEKRVKFRASELPEWLRWMRRHGVVPTGTGPTTTTGRLFA